MEQNKLSAIYQTKGGLNIMKNFLLQTKVAQRLYFDYAADQFLPK